MLALNLRALVDRLDDPTTAAFKAAGSLCLARGHAEIEIEHYLVSLLEQPGSAAKALLERCGIDCPRLTAQLAMNLSRLASAKRRTPAISRRLRVLLRDSWTLASLNFSSEKIAFGHVLLALAWSDDLEWSTPDELLRLDGDRLSRDLASGEARPSDDGIPPAGPAEPKRALSVFLCYRREDGEAYAGRLYDCFKRELGACSVFLDTDEIDPGDPVAKVIENRITACDVMVVLIGKGWLKAADKQGRKRLDESSDWVRWELAAALSREKRVVPCLLGGAKMPRAAELPSDIAGIAARQAVEISLKTFKRDTETLLNLLRRFGMQRLRSSA